MYINIPLILFKSACQMQLPVLLFSENSDMFLTVTDKIRSKFDWIAL
jgi:hypothetical protein